jgi:succinoglycan biosynthesis transport protein ExoP
VAQSVRHPSAVATDLSRPQRRRLVAFALAGTVLGVLVSLLYVVLAPPVYEVTAFADVRRTAPDATSSIYAAIDAISAEANSSEVIRGVIQDLDLTETVGELRSMVVVKPLFGNPSIRVTVTEGSAARAAEIARGFVTAMKDLPVPEQLSNAPDYRIDARLPSVDSLSPTTPKPSHDLVSGAFLGLAAGLVAATWRRASATQTEATHAE